MFHQVMNRYAGVVVWCRLPPYAPTDFADHLAMVKLLVEDEALAARALAVLVPGDDTESPPAAHRKAMHALLGRFPPTACGMVVGADKLTQGVLTAFRWLGVFPAPLYAFGAWDEASSSPSLPIQVRAKVVIAKELSRTVEQWHAPGSDEPSLHGSAAERHTDRQQRG